jgi:hypothetical protein
MKNNNLLIGVGLAAAAGVAYFVSKVKKQKELITDTEIKAKQDAEKAAADLAKAVAKAKVDAESIANKNSFAAKVTTIQLYLGLGPNSDGKVGPNTNMALVKKFPKYSTITTANVNNIIADIDSDKKSASDLAAQKTATSSLQQKVEFAKRLETLTNGSYYAVLLEDVSAPAYAFDSLTNSYRYLGTSKKFYKGSQFRNNLVSRGNGEILIKDGTTRYAVNPNSFIVKSR